MNQATADDTARDAPGQVARRDGLSRLEIAKDLVADAVVTVQRLRRDIAAGAVTGISFEDILAADVSLADADQRLRQAGRP